MQCNKQSAIYAEKQGGNMGQIEKYKLLDTGNQEKLEQVGKYKIIRPAPVAFWNKSLSKDEWSNVDGIYIRSNKGGGHWEWNIRQPESWMTEWGGLNLIVKPTNFGHLGFFAEQIDNWQWLKNVISSQKEEMSVLNLFAYSGGSSLSMASAGASVCHLDAAKGMNEWGKKILESNKDIPKNIRWITDDATKFVKRESRRKQKYNGIVLDPPSYGRGSGGQIWKIEEDLVPLLEEINNIIDKSRPFFILFSCHSPGFSGSVLSRMLSDIVGLKPKIEYGEMIIPENSGKLFAAGSFTRHLYN